MLSGRFIAFLLLVFEPFGYCHRINNNNNKVRMYNAEEAIDGQFPFVALLLRRNEKKFFSCSSVIIGESWVMTAMHCIRDGSNPRNHLVVAGRIDLTKYLEDRFKGIGFDGEIDEGKYGVQERRAKAVYRNPGHFGLGRHDLGLLKVDRPFMFGDRVSSIPVATAPFHTISNDCFVAGYGLTEKKKSYRLHYLDKMVAKPASKCRFQKEKDIICLGEKSRGICKGDSGGPLICSGFLCGIASHALTTSQECGRGIVEQYYTDVYSNLEWITNVIAYRNGTYHPNRFIPKQRL